MTSTALNIAYVSETILTQLIRETSKTGQHYHLHVIQDRAVRILMLIVLTPVEKHCSRWQRQG